MPSMTPIKDVVVTGSVVYTVDWADKEELVCVCPSGQTAEWVAWSLMRVHVPHKLEPSPPGVIET